MTTGWKPQWGKSFALRAVAATLLAVAIGSTALWAEDRSVPPGPAGPAPTLSDQLSGALLPTINPLPAVSVIPEASEYLIDLPTALRLAETDNPQIALGREAIQEAVALHLEARSLLLPNLNAGTNYHLHTGALQTSFGEIRTLREQSVYFGGGARTLAAETVAVPAVRIFTQLGDAIFAPLAAQQVVSERSSTSVAIEHNLLLEVATHFLNLVAAETKLEAYRSSQAEMSEIERTTEAFSKTGQGRHGDYKRAAAEVLLLRMEEQHAQEQVAVASAELARLLHLDPSVRLTTPKAPIELVQLVDPSFNVEQLVQSGLFARPELAARSSEIGAAEIRYKQERMRPFLPLISVGYSAGGFGGGSNRQDLNVPSMFMRTGTRTDFDVWAIWSVQNLGFGNRAIQRRALAEQDLSIARRSLMYSQVRREVTEAHAQALASRQRIIVTRQQLGTAERGAWEELQRTRGGESLPIEAIDSLDLLAQARQDAIGALLDYNTAQFRLFVAIGETPLNSEYQPTMSIKDIAREGTEGLEVPNPTDANAQPQ